MIAWFRMASAAYRGGMEVAIDATVTRHLKCRLLKRAADIVGDNVRLSELLDVEHHALELWLGGRATLPTRVFEKAMEIVLEDDVTRAGQDRRSRPRQLQRPAVAA